METNQEKQIQDMRTMVKGLEAIELPKDFDLSLTMYGVCKMVLHLDEDQARAAMGEELYQRAKAFDLPERQPQKTRVDPYLVEIAHYWPQLSEWQKIKFTFMVWMDTGWAGKVWRWLVQEFKVE